MACPLCAKPFTTMNGTPPLSLWHHINATHISRGLFPPSDFITQHSRLICSTSHCHWIYHSKFKCCQRSTGQGRCRGALVDPSNLSYLPFPSPRPHPPVASANQHSHPASADFSAAALPSTDLLEIALSAVAQRHLPAEHEDKEEICFNTLMDSIMSFYVPTIAHIPRSCRPLFGEALAKELRSACSDSLWGAARLFLLGKCVLRTTRTVGSRNRASLSPIIKSRLKRWAAGDIAALWKESIINCDSCVTYQPPSNVKRALKQAKQGHYGKAIQSLQSKGIASFDNTLALQDLVKRHPQSDLPPHQSQPPAPVVSPLIKFTRPFSHPLKVLAPVVRNYVSITSRTSSVVALPPHPKMLLLISLDGSTSLSQARLIPCLHLGFVVHH